jgi:putative FmdB family regulatory protein
MIRIMPIYDFECGACAARFEELVGAGETPACPECGSTEVSRLYSQVAPTPRLGLRGAAARHSDATRKAREEGRREEFAKRRKRS